MMSSEPARSRWDTFWDKRWEGMQSGERWFSWRAWIELFLVVLLIQIELAVVEQSSWPVAMIIGAALGIPLGLLLFRFTTISAWTRKTLARAVITMILPFSGVVIVTFSLIALTEGRLLQGGAMAIGLCSTLFLTWYLLLYFRLRKV